MSADGAVRAGSEAPEELVATPAGGVARNSMLNLAGQGLPLLAAAFCMPTLIDSLGADRFGVLTLAWMVIGYFSLFDLGLGRALTQVVAARVPHGHATQAPSVVWPALGLMFALGVVGALILGLLTPWIVERVLNIPPALRAETTGAFYILAAAIPVVVVTTGLAGILAAYLRFGVLNAIRAPMGAFTFMAPVLVLPFSRSLVAVTAALAVGRVLAGVAHAIACAPLMPRARGSVAAAGDVQSLFRFGAWMTVSNIIGPLMLYLDRFVIGSTLTVAAVAYYATPYEMVTKLLIVPGAVLGVLFPAFSASFASQPAHLVTLVARGTKYIALLLFPVITVVVAFAPEILRLWLGEEFARQSASVLRCMAVGVFINASAQVFATLIQSAGRPDITAKLHVVELPLYLIGLWWAIAQFGILGAALAWVGRASLDAVLLLRFAARFLTGAGPLVRRMAISLSVATALLCLPILFTGIVPRGLTALVVLLAFSVASWREVLDTTERSAVRARFRLATP